MRITTLAAAGAFVLLPTLVQAQAAVPPTPAVPAAPAPLTLAQALAQAETADPLLRARQAQLAAAEGAATEAGAPLQNNPQFNTEFTRRKVPSGSATERQREWTVGVSQTFEVAGQAGHRRQAADSALRAAQLEVEAMRLQQRAEVSQRFYRVLALQQRADLEAQASRLFDDTARAVERRRAAGEDTRLDANVAQVEAERARNQLASVQEQLIEARAALAVPLQLPPEQLPAAAGDLVPAALPYTEDALLAQARAHPRLQALAARHDGARSRLQLERAARHPDVTVGVNVGREGAADARERLTTLSVSVPLPLFKRNAAGIGTALSEASQAQIEQQAAERDVPAQVLALWSRLRSLAERVERLQRSVLPALSANEQLSAKSLRAGQIGLLELIVTHRQALDARRDLVEALLDYHTTRLSLEAAAGWTPQP